MANYVPPDQRRLEEQQTRAAAEAKSVQSFGQNLSRQIGDGIEAISSAIDNRPKYQFEPGRFLPQRQANPLGISPVTRAAPPAIARPDVTAGNIAPSARPPLTAPILGEATPKRGALNTFTGSNGVTRTIGADGSISGRGSNLLGTPGGGSFAVAPAAQVLAAAAAPARPTQSPLAGAAPTAMIPRPDIALDTSAVDAATRRASTAAERVLDPRTAENELMRRMQHTQNSARFKGSPSARAAAAAPYLDALGQGMRAASARQSQVAGLAGDNARINGGLADTAMRETGANARTGAELQARAQEGAAERAFQLARPQPITLADGTLGMLDASGKVMPATMDGKPVRPADADGGKALRDAMDGLATDALDILAGSMQPGEQATPAQIRAAREQAAQVRGLRLADGKDADGNAISLVNINGQWMPL